MSEEVSGSESDRDSWLSEDSATSDSGSYSPEEDSLEESDDSDSNSGMSSLESAYDHSDSHSTEDRSHRDSTGSWIRQQR